MTIELLISCIVSFLAGGLVAWLVLRRSVHATEESLEQHKMMVRDLEVQVHERQREAAVERNRLELEHQDRMKAVRADASEEGRQLGLAEAKHDRITELTAQQASFAERLAAEREAVVRDTRERTRAEFELQAKLYDVSVRPYLKVENSRGLFKDQDIIEAGYQYQLLVNGIPAFQPSVIVEETRRSSKVNEENVKALLQVAERAAKAAADLYLGAGAAAAKLGPAIIRRITK